MAVELKLTDHEGKVLAWLMDHVSGNPRSTVRADTIEIRKKLYEAGAKLYSSDPQFFQGSVKALDAPRPTEAGE